MYTATTLNGNTDFYFNNKLLWKSVVFKGLFKDKFYIEDANKTRLLELEIKHFLGFGKKYLIEKQKLYNQIGFIKIKKKLYLKVENDMLSLDKKMRAWKFEGDFIINEKKIGNFKNKLKLFESSFTFDFYSGISTNIYCIILFSILVIDEFNTRPPS